MPLLIAGKTLFIFLVLTGWASAATFTVDDGGAEAQDLYPLMKTNGWLLSQTDTWIPYTPTSSQTIIDFSTIAGITYANVTLTFESSGYRILDWGNVSRVGNEFSVDARIERFTGPVLTVMTYNSNGYLIGNLSSGNYSFIFKVRGNPVITKEFYREAIDGNIVSRYSGSDGIVQRSEAVQAVVDYFNGLITRQEAIDVVMAYFA
jgi:hypothetical protein